MKIKSKKIKNFIVKAIVLIVVLSMILTGFIVFFQNLF